jgi:comEA protein
LILITAVLCALVIGYNAFYVPDAPLSEPTAVADAVSSSSGIVSREKSVSEEGLNPFLPGMGKESSLSGVSEESGGNVSPSNWRQSSVPQPENSSPKKLSHKININTATAQELSEGLDGIGDGLAERIVAYRKQHGSFQSIDQIKNVSGIGDKRYEKIRNFITVQ